MKYSLRKNEDVQLLIQNVVWQTSKC